MSCENAKNLCNDLNRLAAVNLIGLSIDSYMGRKVDLRAWKDGFLQDIGILMVYHQVLHYISKNFDNSELAADLIKSSCFLLVPKITNFSSVNWRKVATTLSGVTLYHKLIRPYVMKFLEKHDITESSIAATEDLTETVLLLAMSRDAPIATIISQLLAIGVFHTFIRTP